MGEQLLRCRCGASAFYLTTKDVGLVFFKIASDGRPIFESQADAESTRIDETTVIYCTACSWEGTIAELKDSQNKFG
ncbi:MAG: hypothetical protein HZA01_12855 [Nitrospinae bacterium]|nr:hypothetical protein [Nitrospinota bacterium]